MTAPAAANHPRHCAVCHGTGWQPGPDVDARDVHGRELRTYATYEPCTHHWSNDDPHPENLISLTDYLDRHPEDRHLFDQARARHPSAHHPTARAVELEPEP